MIQLSTRKITIRENTLKLMFQYLRNTAWKITTYHSTTKHNSILFCIKRSTTIITHIYRDFSASRSGLGRVSTDAYSTHEACGKNSPAGIPTDASVHTYFHRQEKFSRSLRPPDILNNRYSRHYRTRKKIRWFLHSNTTTVETVFSTLVFGLLFDLWNAREAPTTLKDEFHSLSRPTRR